MTPNVIRAKAFAVLRRGDAILVSPGEDKGQRFGRIVGGTIEFGETSSETIVREMQEELGITVTPTRLLGWIENIFDYNGEAGHQLCAIWEVECTDADFYQHEHYKILDSEDFTAEWLSPSRMQAEGIKLYPVELTERVWPA